MSDCVNLESCDPGCVGMGTDTPWIMYLQKLMLIDLLLFAGYISISGTSIIRTN